MKSAERLVATTPAECSWILERFPSLTTTGFYKYGEYHLENDRRANAGLPPKVYKPPVPITCPDALRQIAIVRYFIRENRADSSTRLHISYELKYEVRRWAVGEYISNGAVIAALVLEGCNVSRFGANAFCWLSLPPELHARLSGVTRAAIAYMDTAVGYLHASRFDS